MLYTSYRTRLPVDRQDALARFVIRAGGWLSLRYTYTLYTVPEHLGYMLAIFDSQIERVASEDWIG